ncbi:MAG TPA: helix-hairpin-helix domain-containing protein [Pseudosphingobacterium sp.]|nr:helix-hairpin-helix domain-containing protein [Pseudosphingobacterium sp.]
MYFIQKYFNLSKRELNGISVLLVITLGIWCIPFLYDIADVPEPEYYEEIIQKTNFYKDESVAVPVAYFDFDPNKLNAEAWKRLGLLTPQIKAITNYRAKGGVFYKKEDLKKIYTLSEADYKKLEPYIHITAKSLEKKGGVLTDSAHLQKKETKATFDNLKKIPVLDLNIVDTIDLMQLPGIGPVYAKRILKYRDLLGGYCKLEQLQEVYGMDSLRFEAIKPFLQIDRNAIKQIFINKVGYQELRKHPYVDANHAKVIVQYRGQHGIFKNIEDLANIVLFDKDYLRKIEPYLNFSND